MAVKVSDKDLGWTKAMKGLADLGGVVVTVGLHSDAEPYQRGQAAPANVAQIGAVHEFGSEDGRVPARPWLRPPVDANQAEYVALTKRLAGRVIDGDLSAKQLGDVLGAKVTADVQKSIVDVVSPILAPATIERKAALSKTGDVRVEAGVETGNPLIDTGHMRQSVTYVVATGRRALATAKAKTP